VIGRRSRVSALVLGLLVGPFCPAESQAAIWPTETDWVERGLESQDVSDRREAARRLAELPVASRDRLVKRALLDDDVDVRVGAAESLVDTNTDEHATVALAWLGERDARLRLAAIRVLVRARPTREILQALSRALGDTDLEVRVRAAHALGNSRDPSAALSLLGHIDEANMRMQLAVVEALAALRDPKALVALVGKVQDGRPAVREAVARSLRVFEGERALAALVLLLRDSDDSVRLAAVSSLGRASAAEALDAIVHVLKNDSSIDVRVAAVRALARTRSERAADVLIESLDDPRGEIVSEARLSLARMGSGSVPRLLACLAGQPSRVRADACVFALGRSERTDVADAVSDAWRRRAVSPDAALEALTALRAKQALPVVLESLSDDDPWVRSRAFGALEVMLDPDEPDGRAVEPLLAAARAASERPDELLLLVSLLGRTGSDRVKADLVEYARSSRLRLRLAAIRSLGWVKAQGTDELLLEAIDSPEPRSRREAALAIRRAGGESLGQPLLDRLERTSERDAVWLGLALAGPLSSTHNAELLASVERRIAKSSGPLRDALLEALGASPLGGELLVQIGKSAGAKSRAKIAELLSSHPKQRTFVLELLKDGGVTRQHAAWTIGVVGTSADLERVGELILDRDPRVAANAAVSYGRLAHGTAGADTKPLCLTLSHRQPALRAGGLMGLRLAGLRCGENEQDLLARDPSPAVRLAAAELLSRDRAEPEIAALLERCLDEERDGRVAAACAPPATNKPPAERAPLLTAFVFPPTGTEPQPGLPYAIRFADGTVRHGEADRRGALSDPKPLRGAVSLEVPLLDDSP
jgi:cellulose synthase operon protein C